MPVSPAQNPPQATAGLLFAALSSHAVHQPIAAKEVYVSTPIAAARKINKAFTISAPNGCCAYRSVMGSERRASELLAKGPSLSATVVLLLPLVTNVTAVPCDVMKDQYESDEETRVSHRQSKIGVSLFIFRFIVSVSHGVRVSSRRQQ